MKKNKHIYITYLAIVVFISIFARPSNGLATDYYIDPSGGNDGNSGTSLPNAWKTIGKANSSLQPGDTVFIRQGVYKETIRPSRSGANGQYITYTNYNDEEVTLKNIQVAINFSSRKYIKINGINVDGENIGDSANVQQWIVLDGGSYNIIQNGNFQKGRGWACMQLESGAHHNKILNNTMQYCGSYDRDNGDMIKIDDSSHYNLVEGNTASYGGHNILILYGDNNIIRSNEFTNPWERLAEARQYQAGLHSVRNLIENNKFHGASPATDNAIPPSIKLLGEHQIIRRNMIYSNTSYGFQISPKDDRTEAHHLKIYNNVFYNNGKEAITLFINNSPNVNTSFSRIKNNIFYKNGSSQEIKLATEANGFNDISITYNNLFRSSQGEALLSINPYGRNSVDWYENNHNENINNNLNTDPGFVDAPNGNFHLKSNSPMIDKGGFLASVTSNNGSGTSFAVDDAGYFMDGWGVIDGDMIQLEGQSQAVRITSINYDTNTINVNQSISWNQGSGVSLSYRGLAPDIGAYEFASTDCTSHFTRACFENDVYWYDSCGNREEKFEECGPDGICQSGECVAIISHDHKECFDDDVYWFNNLNSREEKFEECGAEGICQNGECVTFTKHSNYFEAEHMITTPPMTIIVDNYASGGQHISPTSGVDSSSPSQEASYESQIEDVGTYYLWVRMLGVNSTGDALYVGIDNSWDRVFPSAKGSYEWVRVENSNNSGSYGFNLAAGSHTIQIGHGEINAIADVLFLTNDPNEIPQTDINQLQPPFNNPSAPGNLRIEP